MPPPVAGSPAFYAALPDFGGEERAKAMPPKPDGLMADLDAALMQQVLDVPQREREPDVHHDRQADDLGRRLEVLEGAGFAHLGTLLSPLPRRKQSSPDKTALKHKLFSDEKIIAC
jgi:hypothetical protein